MSFGNTMGSFNASLETLRFVAREIREKARKKETHSIILLFFLAYFAYFAVNLSNTFLLTTRVVLQNISRPSQLFID